MEAFQGLGRFLYGLGSMTWISAGLLIFILCSPQLRAILLENLKPASKDAWRLPEATPGSPWWDNPRFAMKLLIGVVVGIPVLILVGVIIVNA